MTDQPKIDVAYYQRRPRPAGNFSIESIFADLRTRLADRIDSTVHTSSALNDGIKTKFTNIWEARRRLGSEDVCHITGEVHFLNLLLPKSKVVLTVHDCRFMQRKAGNPLAARFMKWLYLDGPVAKSRIVTTVSQATKDDIINYTGCPPDLIRVIPVTVDAGFTSAPQPFNTQRPNVLQIGTSENKNLARVVEALTPLKASLTVVGKLSDEQTHLLERSGLSYTNYYNIPQAELIGLYHNCDVLSFVSTFEGFGMPIVEANATERVVLTSNLSSMPEVAGDAALLVDPLDVADIRNGFHQLFTNAGLRERLLSAGRKNARRFDPTTVAEQYFACYQEIAATPKI